MLYSIISSKLWKEVQCIFKHFLLLARDALRCRSCLTCLTLLCLQVKSNIHAQKVLRGNSICEYEPKSAIYQNEKASKGTHSYLKCVSLHH